LLEFLQTASVSSSALQANEESASVEIDGLNRFREAEYRSSKDARPSRGRHIEPPKEDVALLDCYPLSQ
jgi:hypothetical protein